jgi:hypothetical protein
MKRRNFIGSIAGSIPFVGRSDVSECPKERQMYEEYDEKLKTVKEHIINKMDQYLRSKSIV